MLHLRVWREKTNACNAVWFYQLRPRGSNGIAPAQADRSPSSLSRCALLERSSSSLSPAHNDLFFSRGSAPYVGSGDTLLLDSKEGWTSSWPPGLPDSSAIGGDGDIAAVTRCTVGCCFTWPGPCRRCSCRHRRPCRRGSSSALISAFPPTRRSISSAARRKTPPGSNASGLRHRGCRFRANFVR